MPTKASIIGLSAVLAVTAGCDLVSPGQRLSYAVAMTQCGPADEGFTRIVLADEPIQSAQTAFPSVQVVIWKAPTDLPGHTYSVRGNVAAGAWYVTGPGKNQDVLSGSVTIESVDSADTVKGSVELRFPSRFVHTSFTAPWISSGVFCN